MGPFVNRRTVGLGIASGLAFTRTLASVPLAASDRSVMLHGSGAAGPITVRAIMPRLSDAQREWIATMSPEEIRTTDEILAHYGEPYFREHWHGLKAELDYARHF